MLPVDILPFGLSGSFMLRNDKPLPHVFPILFICTVGCGCFVAVARGVETVCMGLIRSTDVDAVGVDCMVADGVFGCWAGCCADVEEAEIFEIGARLLRCPSSFSLKAGEGLSSWHSFMSRSSARNDLFVASR